MSNMIIKKVNTLYDGHSSLKIAEIEHLYDDGQEKSFSREILKARNSVVVLLYLQDTKKLILTSQWRAAIVFCGGLFPLIEACAGNIDEKDIEKNPDDELSAANVTAVREVEEETGWHIAKLNYVYALYSCPGISTEKLYYYVAIVGQKIKPGGGLRSEGEDIAVIEMTLSEAVEKVRNGEIKDLKTVNLIQYFQLHHTDFL